MILNFYRNYKNLIGKVNELEERIVKLEDENISLTNELYRMENSLDSRIDIFMNDMILKNNWSNDHGIE